MDMYHFNFVLNEGYLIGKSFTNITKCKKKLIELYHTKTNFFVFNIDLDILLYMYLCRYNTSMGQISNRSIVYLKKKKTNQYTS